MAIRIPLLWSSVGRKYLMAATGLCWLAFVTLHLLGNLALLFGADVFNEYAHKMVAMGPLLWVAEALLVATLLLHATAAVTVTLENRRARRTPYAKVENAGGPSRKTLSSRTMIYTGALLLVFLGVHLATFKFGPYYHTVIEGVRVRDLYRTVVEGFQSEAIMLFHVVCMVFLGLHLRHGFWSAFQSLGLMHSRWSKPLYAIGTLYAIAFALGYVILPVYAYFFLGGTP